MEKPSDNYKDPDTKVIRIEKPSDNYKDSGTKVEDTDKID
jgi:hypothetical protein